MKIDYKKQIVLRWPAGRRLWVYDIAKRTWKTYVIRGGK